MIPGTKAFGSLSAWGKWVALGEGGRKKCGDGAAVEKNAARGDVPSSRRPLSSRGLE